MPPSGRVSKLPPKAQQSPATSTTLKNKIMQPGSWKQSKQPSTEFKSDRKTIETPIKNNMYYAPGSKGAQSKTILGSQSQNQRDVLYKRGARSIS